MKVWESWNSWSDKYDGALVATAEEALVHFELCCEHNLCTSTNTRERAEYEERMCIGAWIGIKLDTPEREALYELYGFAHPLLEPGFSTVEAIEGLSRVQNRLILSTREEQESLAASVKGLFDEE